MKTFKMTSIQTIPEFYAGRTVFVTGATGFMGKVLIEKLLRSCPDIKSIYILVRSKKGQNPQKRVHELLKSKLFDLVRKAQPNFEEKVRAIAGDMMGENGLDISDEDMQVLINEVSIVFHSAATVRFDEPLKLSIQMNVIGVQKMINLAKNIKNLEAFIHVSTAYANCDREEMSETVYALQLHPKKILDAAEWMTDDTLDALSPKIVNPRPNTYTYTKAMAEYLLIENKGDMPVAIVRPSIVGASWKEPLPGWVDNFNGPTGLFAAIGKGILRSMHGNTKATADIIPVDIATNLMIVVGWYTALERPTTVKVYNSTSGELNKVTWGDIQNASFVNFMKTPLDNIARVPSPAMTTSRVWRNLNMIFDHYLPAFLMDVYNNLSGKKALYVALQEKLWRSVNCLEFFTSHSWKFSNENVLELQNYMCESDATNFNFDVRTVHWNTYLENYCMGTKQYALKENMADLPKAREHVQRLLKRNKMISAVMWIVLFRLLYKRFAVIQNIWHFITGLIISLLKKIPQLMIRSS